MKLTVNDKTTYTTATLQELDADIHRAGPSAFHVLSGGRSFRAEVLERDPATKTYLLRVNDNEYRVSITDKYDELLASLGMDAAGSSRVTELKAPMPGLVLHILVKVGDTVKKNDSLLTLEAMKMENILRSPGDGIVKSIKVNLGDKVEKSQVLVTFN